MKDYASQQRKPGKHMLGLGLVVLLHILVFWAINSGLAKKFVKVIKGPVEAQLIEDAKPDIPPPPPRRRQKAHRHRQPMCRRWMSRRQLRRASMPLLQCLLPQHRQRRHLWHLQRQLLLSKQRLSSMLLSIAKSRSTPVHRVETKRRVPSSFVS